MPVIVNDQSLSLVDLLLHREPMLLLDDVVACDDDSCTTVLTLRADNLFAQADGSVPAYVGIEFMAQTIAAWAGIQAALQGDAVQLGFLLGSRKYSAAVGRFAVGQSLQVRAAVNYRQDDLSVFTCTIHDLDANSGGALLAEANINVYQPRDAAAFLREVIGQADVAGAQEMPS